MNTVTTLNTFAKAYIEAALWSSVDDNGVSLDTDHSWRDLAPDTLDKMLSDCCKFESENADSIGTDSKKAGHDFWLTRNQHGAGFWDGDWNEPEATRLTNAAHTFGAFVLYIGDDGKIYV